MSYNWSPTGWEAHYRETLPNGNKHMTSDPVQQWGPNGEPMIVKEKEGLVDARTLPGFELIDICGHVNGMVAAHPGWSVQITHPNGDVEAKPVAAWLLDTDGSAYPMVPSDASASSPSISPAGHDFKSEYALRCRIAQIPPQL